MSTPPRGVFDAASAGADQPAVAELLDGLVDELAPEPRYDTRQRTAELLAEAEPFDQEGFDRTVRGMLDRTRDPALAAALWDHREGRLSRHGLMRMPAFRAERDRWYAEMRQQG